MNKKCALILSDAGPLITLAFADSLDLLLKLDMPIYIVDEVYYEATHNKKFKDAKKIERFIEKNRNVISIPETFIGESASKARIENPDKKLSKNLGELAIQEFANDAMFHLIGNDTPALLLFEDDKNIQISNNKIHLLTTKSFIFTLAELGLIESGINLWKKINKNGRKPSELIKDKPVKTKKYESFWEPS